MMLRATNDNNRGQTLIELIVSIGVVVFVMLALVVAVTSSLRFGQSSRLRSTAVKYAQEGIELSRQYRDANPWSDFLAFASPVSTTWCLDKDGTWTQDTGSGCALIDERFTRVVTFSYEDPLVHVRVVVSWPDGSQTSQTTNETYLSEW